MTETEIEVALNDHENEIKSMKHRMDKAESNIDQIHELVTSVKLLAQKQDDLVSSVSAIQTDIKSLKEIPATRWNNATQTVVSGVISAIVAAICAAVIKFI